MKGKTNAWRWGLMAGLAAGLLLLTAWNQEKSEEQPRRPRIIAHRAGAALGPENTLAALELAIAAGAEGVEVDVRMTRDGRVILLHDGSLARTTGLDRLVGETDWAQIQPLDAGSWHSPDFAGEPIPTLEQMLEAVRGRTQLMVEVKEGEPLQIVDRTVEAIRQAGMEEVCILASVEPAFLERSKALAPDLRTFYIGSEWSPDLLAQEWADGYSLRLSAVSHHAVELVREAGKELWVWTVNTPVELERALDLGVDGLVTDDPALGFRGDGYGDQRASW